MVFTLSLMPLETFEPLQGQARRMIIFRNTHKKAG